MHASIKLDDSQFAHFVTFSHTTLAHNRNRKLVAAMRRMSTIRHSSYVIKTDGVDFLAPNALPTI